MKSKIKLSRYTIVTAAVWAVSVVVLGGGYFLFYAPQQAELLQVNNQCDESQTALEQAQLAAQDEAREKQKQQCEDVSQLISGFSTHQDSVTELVFEIGRIANELRLSEFSSKDQKQKKPSAEVRLHEFLLVFCTQCILKKPLLVKRLEKVNSQISYIRYQMSDVKCQ